MSDNHHDDYQAAYRGMLEEISNDEELDGRVMARVHDLRSGQQEAENVQHATGQRTSATRQVPLLRSPAYTRRAIVTAGAAIAGCALLGVAVPLARTLNMRGSDESENPDSTQTPAGSARGQAVSPHEDVQSFGLAVANADEVGAGTRATFELAPTSSGLVPVELSATTSVLMLNLATTGAGLEYLNYVIQQAPDAEGPYPLGGSLDEITSAVYFQPWYPYVEMADEQAASTSRDASSQKVTRYTPNQAQAQPNSIPDWVTPEQRESYVSYSPASTSFAATPYAHASGNDGTMLRQGMDSDDPSAAHQMIIVRIPRTSSGSQTQFSRCSEPGSMPRPMATVSARQASRRPRVPRANSQTTPPWKRRGSQSSATPFASSPQTGRHSMTGFGPATRRTCA